MTRTTPSKKISLLALISLIFLGGLVYVLFYMENTKTYVAPTVSLTTTNRLLAKDNDNDGLKDWEEQLWKSDPTNPDSDSDGTPDGLEIKSGRNPNVAGPNDKLDMDTVTNKINTETESDLSETDKFSRELFLKIIAAKKADAPPTEADLESFLNASIEQEIKAQSVRAYGEGDFQVDGKETPEKIKIYGDEIVRILTEKPAKELEYEIDIFERAEKNNDPEELKKLEPLIAQYRNIETMLLKVVVPESALEQHIAFTNSVAGMIYSITGLKYIMTDPIRAVPGVASYAENAESFITTVQQFKNYFKTVDVSFEEGDRGYNFFENI